MCTPSGARYLNPAAPAKPGRHPTTKPTAQPNPLHVQPQNSAANPIEPHITPKPCKVSGPSFGWGLMAERGSIGLQKKPNTQPEGCKD